MPNQETLMDDLASATPLKSTLTKASGWGIAYAILIIIAGFIAISLPFLSGIAITIVIGWLLVVSGVFHIADAFHAKGAGSFFWRLLVGLVFIIGGLDIAFVPLRGLFTLTFVLGIILLVQGVIGLIAFLRRRTMHGAGWVLFNALVTLLLGGIILYDGPGAAVWVIGTLVGINLIFSGISRLMIWFALRRALTAATA
jgi:uncharacterized membrane protein HdeD (DUF308 family)